MNGFLEFLLALPRGYSEAAARGLAQKRRYDDAFRILRKHDTQRAKESDYAFSFHLLRAQLLFQKGRYPEAERELALAQPQFTRRLSWTPPDVRYLTAYVDFLGDLCRARPTPPVHLRATIRPEAREGVDASYLRDYPIPEMRSEGWLMLFEVFGPPSSA